MTTLGPLTGKRILVLEDEYFIAADVRRALADRGALVIGPAGSVSGGLALAGEPLDAAVLDVNIEGRRSFAVADQLSQQGIPFMFVTGYDIWAMPDAYRDVPRMTKPCRMDQLIQTVEKLVADG